LYCPVHRRTGHAEQFGEFTAGVPAGPDRDVVETARESLIIGAA
jgi:hypothetical protein